ncbi:MAG: alpha/beta fold hydrolase [Flavipsychrobacter sp.]
MKKTLLVLIAALITVNGLAQDQFVGDWFGSLNVGQELQIVFHISNNEALKATLDVPKQGAKAIPCNEVIAKGNTIIINIELIKSRFSGTLNNGIIKGNWIQNGMNIPVELSKQKPQKTVLKRPQTPEPPFSYNSTNLIYHNKDKSIQYGATITVPAIDKKHPAVILITGSGAQNRDEEIEGHKPFAVIANHLTNNGYAVLRIDDRGVGETTGNTNATSADFAEDIIAGIEYLKSRDDIDAKKIGLYGHSEGGLIAPMVANKTKDVNFIILAAGPGIPVIDLMSEQNYEILLKMGITDEMAKAYTPLYRDIMSILTTAENKKSAEIKINNTINSWKTRTDKQTVAITTGISDEATQKVFANQFLKLYDSKWLKYFISYDPTPALKKLRCKVLAINGDNDIQVISKSNLAGIESALKKSKVKSYEVKEFKGLNHLFQSCNTCNTQEYGKIETTFEPVVLDYITDWLDENVK